MQIRFSDMRWESRLVSDSFVSLLIQIIAGPVVGSVYHGCDGHFAGGAVYPWIYLGLYFCRGTLQFQRLFLCVWKIRDFVCPQPDCDSLCPYSRRLPDFKDLPGYAVSDGTGYGDRFAAVGDHLYDCVRTG